MRAASASRKKSWEARKNSWEARKKPAAVKQKPSKQPYVPPSACTWVTYENEVDVFMRRKQASNKVKVKEAEIVYGECFVRHP